MGAPIGQDGFGYDDNGQPCAARISPNVFAFGYTFCSRLKGALEAGFQIGHHLYADKPIALICVHSPNEQASELWSGIWQQDGNLYDVVDPKYLGVIAFKFTDVNSTVEFLRSGRPVPLLPTYLSASGMGIAVKIVPVHCEFAEQVLCRQ